MNEIYFIVTFEKYKIFFYGFKKIYIIFYLIVRFSSYDFFIRIRIDRSNEIEKYNLFLTLRYVENQLISRFILWRLL